MSIYTKTNYRKIYEQYYGSIPTDSNGRTYEIHHIDGDHSNNEPDNLIALSIQEHYDVHYSQEDWNACSIIAQRIGMDPKDASDLSREFTLNRVADGTHPWLSGEHQRKSILERLENGTHPSQVLKTCEHCNKTMGMSNYEKWHGNKCASIKPRAKGSCFGPRKQSLNKTCPHCSKSTDPSTYSRWHGDNCKLAPDNVGTAIWTCPHCNKTGRHLGNYTMWHGEKCKLVSTNIKIDK